jgi:hypothetical protein
MKYIFVFVALIVINCLADDEIPKCTLRSHYSIVGTWKLPHVANLEGKHFRQFSFYRTNYFYRANMMDMISTNCFAYWGTYSCFDSTIIMEYGDPMNENSSVTHNLRVIKLDSNFLCFRGLYNDYDTICCQRIK